MKLGLAHRALDAQKEPLHEKIVYPSLMPELYGFLNPMPFEAAAQMEKDLAEDLRADGYTVTGGRLMLSTKDKPHR